MTVPHRGVTNILHITTRREWHRSQVTGCYESDTLRSQGFIHCSTADQVIGVANSYDLFRGQTDLVILCIDADRVLPEIRYENLQGGEELFPHIYGSLNLNAVTQVLSLVPNLDGVFALPEGL